MEKSFGWKTLHATITVAFGLAGLLAGCGGGGGGGASSVPTSGTVVGSYFRNAVVCFDTNNNAACDAGEPSARTDSSGAFQLGGTPANIVADIGTDALRFDPDTNSATPVTSRIILRAPMDAPGVVNVISTSVLAEMEANNLSFADARAKVAAALGVSADKLLSDFNKETDAATKTKLKSASDDGIQRIQILLAALKSGDDLRKTLITATSTLDKIKTVVVIYAENHGFDNLYGLFPGANGINNALNNPNSYLQLDRDGTTVLSRLPAAWSASAGAQAASLAFVATLPNKPFRIDAPPGGVPGLPIGTSPPDLVHRFYNNQMQINGGKNNLYAAFSDAGGLSMGYYDGSSMALWNIAKQYTLSDNFYQGAFGGSFLNHFWLVCACTPTFATPPAARLSSVDASGVKLNLDPASPASALTGPPKYVADLNVTPTGGFAINTTQPPFQPSGTAPAAGGDSRLADPGGSNPPLNAQDSSTVKTVGDTLTAKGINWKWYAGAWNAVLADRTLIYNNTVPNFQAHHHPFNYFSRFDPTTPAGAVERAAHLQDYQDLVNDAQNGTLPPVSFYKPQGNLNQHPGYTDVQSGDAHIADVIAKLQASPQWKNMAVIVTYDENGGFFDHAAPPRIDKWGPGTRVPTLIISPYAKKGYVDSTVSDTTSIIKFLTRRFGLSPLPGAQRPVSDLSNAFDVTQ